MMYYVILCMKCYVYCYYFFLIYFLFLKSLTRDNVCKLAMARSPIYVARLHFN